MATDTILPENSQQFADDEIVDNFGATDDGVPMGIGGEKGKQSEPVSSTLEADMLQPAPKKPKQEEKTSPDDAIPPDDAAAGGESKPVHDAARDDGKAKAEPQTEEPESTEFPDTLLRMAGFSNSEDAQKAGFKDPESLLAAVQWRSRSMAAPAKPSRSSYLESETTKPEPTFIPAKETPQGDGTFKRFKPTNPEIFDEELLKLLEEQDRHYADQFEQLSSKLNGSNVSEALRQAERFDKAVQELGANWEAELGKGSGDTLFQSTDAESVAAAQNRLDLFDAVNLLRQTNAERGGKPMSIEQEVQWALMQRYPDKFKQQLLRERETKVQGRRGAQASRPTARKTPLGTKNERILSELQSKYPNVDFSQGDTDLVGDI